MLARCDGREIGGEKEALDIWRLCMVSVHIMCEEKLVYHAVHQNR